MTTTMTVKRTVKTLAFINDYNGSATAGGNDYAVAGNDDDDDNLDASCIGFKTNLCGVNMFVAGSTVVLIGSLQDLHGNITHVQALLQATASWEDQRKVKVIFLEKVIN